MSIGGGGISFGLKGVYREFGTPIFSGVSLLLKCIAGATCFINYDEEEVGCYDIVFNYGY